MTFSEFNDRFLFGFGPGICAWLSFIGAIAAIIWWFVEIYSGYSACALLCHGRG